MKCPACQNELPDDANFCLTCGHKIGTKDPSPPSISYPDAERKRVTALFSDLSGYTAMTVKLDPEDVKEITGCVFDGVREIVNKYEGFIERFAGDGVLALFGVPRAHEDDPIRAIQAAQEIHAFVESLSSRYAGKVGCALSMHSGINTGLAVTADVDRGKGTHGITGEAINVASRLSDLAGAREIYVGPDTYKASQVHFNFQALKPTRVKGISEAVTIYKVLSEKSKSVLASQKIQVSSEMVGRDQELAKLEYHVLKAVNGEGSVVNVVGEPGVGKSRLLAELRKRDVVERVNILEGRSISIGKNLSFHPIIDLIKQWSEIKEDDTQAEVSKKLETAIRRVCKEEADEVFPFVATMMSMRLSGKHQQRVEGIEGEALEKLILKNVRELLIRSTELNPILIIMEDIHWADTTSLEFLESLFRLAQDYRIVFINVFRPGYLNEKDRKILNLPQWLPEVDFVEISIKPLDRSLGESLINNILQVKGLPSAVKQQILNRAGGNPFFLEEIVRSLIDEGAIVRTNGVFEVTDRIENVVIPSTINDVLVARIDRLEEQTRDLIKVASVIGRSFFDRVLKEVADSIGDVDDRLAHLKDVQFIRDRMRMEELEYLFNHALAQEAAYESTLLQQRKSLHRKVAQSIENIFQERLHEFYGMLAYHYSMGEEQAKTEEYLIKAGEVALKSSASSEALGYYRQALASYINTHGDRADSDRIAMMEKNIAISLFNKGNYLEALPYFDKLLRRYGEFIPDNMILGIPKLIKSSFTLLLSLYFPFLRWRETPSKKDLDLIELFFRRQVMLIDIDSEKFFYHFLFFLDRFSRYRPEKVDHHFVRFGSASMMFSWSGLSYPLSRKVLSFLKRNLAANDIFSVGFYEFFLSMHNYMAGSWKDESDFNEEIPQYQLSIGEIMYAAIYIIFKGHIILERGDKRLTEKLIEKLNRIFIDYENDYAKLQKYELSIKFSIKYRMLQEAARETREAIAFSSGGGLELYIAFFNTLLARTLAMSDEFQEAERILEKYEAYFQKEVKEPYYLSWYALTGLYLYVGRLKKAVVTENQSDIQDAAKRCRHYGKYMNRICRKAACDRTEGYRLLGVSWMLQGNRHKAFRYWERSIESGEDLGARIELARTYFEVGKRLLEPKSKYKQLNGIDANGYLEKARVMFEEMDLQWDLNELNKIIEK